MRKLRKIEKKVGKNRKKREKREKREKKRKKEKKETGYRVLDFVERTIERSNDRTMCPWVRDALLSTILLVQNLVSN